MATGLRPVADARSRHFEDPRIDAAWQAIDCGFAAVARRLPSTEQMRRYVKVMLDLMRRTSGSIHGKHTTFESPCLPEFLREAPAVLGQLSIGGLRNWVEYGIHHHGEHPERQAEYFALRALWGESEQLVPYSTAFDEIRKPVPYFDALGLRIPDVFDDRAGVSGIDRYRATLAHMIGHRRWSTPQLADNWSPFQRMAVEFLEDARIDVLLGRLYPGLGRILHALHPVPAESACDPETSSCLRHRLAMLSRACIDPDHGYGDTTIREFADRFRALLADGPSSTADMANLALAYVARSRRASDQFAKVHFDDTEVDYRDDNRHLWTFIEDSDDEDFFAQGTRGQGPTGMKHQGLPHDHPRPTMCIQS